MLCPPQSSVNPIRFFFFVLFRGALQYTTIRIYIFIYLRAVISWHRSRRLLWDAFFSFPFLKRFFSWLVVAIVFFPTAGLLVLFSRADKDIFSVTIVFIRFVSKIGHFFSHVQFAICLCRGYVLYIVWWNCHRIFNVRWVFKRVQLFNFCEERKETARPKTM